VVNGVSVAPGQLALLDTSPLLGSADGALQLQWVQEEGKRRSEASEWWRGASLNRESTSWGEEALSL
jgi:methionyl-tRNA formyltransferase